MSYANPNAVGITPTERYLNRLAARSFLSMWSYPSLYRDQGIGKRGEGAEVCDLLVVFENHILIFSDKDCEFPNHADVELAWQRWFRRAILKSAEQVWGAERWIQQHPQRLYLDRQCTQPLQIELPDPAQAQFHRIVVAHDRSGRRKRRIGGTGSLLVDPGLIGEMHLLRESEGGHPFAIGILDPSEGYVHVFDDSSLGRVMRTLDTVTDFANYLDRKQRFILSGRLHGAYGEEDLLAYYLKRVDKAGEHDFIFPANAKRVLIEEGQWANFILRPERSRQVEANKVSYLWDGIIQEFTHHAFAGTLQFSNDPRIPAQERLLRVLAREPRTRRRMLSRALLGKAREQVPAGKYAFRIVQPSFPGDPYYVFVVGSPPTEIAPGSSGWDQYRIGRTKYLEAYCMVTMHQFPTADRVIGIATEAGTGQGRSHDLLQIERANWSVELDTEAANIQQATGWLTNLRVSRGTEDEYPADPYESARSIQPARNDRCPCGSGRKYKKCHGRYKQP